MLWPIRYKFLFDETLWGRGAYICPWCPLLACPKRMQIRGWIAEGSHAVLRQPWPHSTPCISPAHTHQGEEGRGGGVGIASPLALLLTGRTYWRQEATCREDEQRAMPERRGRQREGSAQTFQSSCSRDWGWEGWIQILVSSSCHSNLLLWHF